MMKLLHFIIYLLESMNMNTTNHEKDWRSPNAPKTNTSDRRKSSGISPTKFYKRPNPVKQNVNINVNPIISCSDIPSPVKENLSNIFRKASNRANLDLINEHNVKLKVRRSAFRMVTSVTIYGLQELALQALRGLYDENEENSKYMFQHLPAISLKNLDSSCGDKDDDCDGSEPSGVSLYVSSSDENSNLACKKRTKKVLGNNVPTSPRSSTRRAEHVQLFLKEKRLRDVSPSSESSAFLPALWSTEPRILSIETSKTGRRKYVVGHFGRLADYYWRKLHASSRHYYELIPEGVPCRLYFDIEFSKKYNKEITEDISETLIFELISELIFEFKGKYNLVIDRKCVVDLEASTSEKFSRHLIVHLPNKALFADNCHAGAFVKAFVGRLALDISKRVLAERSPTLEKVCDLKE